jgi:hypothetical protein
LCIQHKPCTYLVPRLTPSLSRPKQVSTSRTSPRSSIGCAQNDFRAYCRFGKNGAPTLRRDLHYLEKEWNELPFYPCHLRVPSVVPKMISEPIACLAQTVQLSCALINTVSKRTKMSFHLTHVTYEVHRVRPRFPCPWYIRHKPCTYRAPRLTPSPSRPKRASTWTTYPRSSIGCDQKYFHACGTFGANRAPILCWD